MEIVVHENNTGFIEPEILAKYGPFSFWERIKIGGTGSKRVYYKSGIDYFDKAVENTTDLPIVNFEMLKNAIFIRLSVHNKSYTLALTHRELEKIELYQHNSTRKISLVFSVQSLEKRHTFVFTLNDISISSFFEKPLFKEKFQLMENTDFH